MPHLLIRSLAAVLAVLGVLAGAVGLWFMTQLGTDGRAAFTAEPGSQTVVLEPSMLNRVDSDVVVEARSEGAVWMGLARPSDAESVMKDAKAARAVDVSVPSWELKTVDSGSGESAPKSYDLWQAQRTGTGSASITVDQAAAHVEVGDDVGERRWLVHPRRPAHHHRSRPRRACRLPDPAGAAGTRVRGR